MPHTRGAPYHPMTQGKIERWHQTLKNRILLDHYFLPDDLEAHIDAFVDHYNDRRPHQALGYRTPMEVWRGERKPAVDMPLRLDNAGALPTCPQPQQQPIFV